VFIDNVSFSPPIPPVNPTVSLTSPLSGADFTAPATINFGAVVGSNGNVIAGVDFVANGATIIAQVTNTPYTFTWTNVPAGNYNLAARVVFNGTNTVTSTSAAVYVTNFIPVIQSIGSGAGGLFVNGIGETGQPYVLMTASNLNNPIVWSPVLTNIANASGMFTFTNLSATNGQQYFRVSGL
jgi:hypothetical protein